MKRFALMLIGLSFGLLIMAVSVVQSSRPTVLADESGGDMKVIPLMGGQDDEKNSTESATASEDESLLATESGAIAVASSVEYELPYPGLLPNHPLYWLKMVRDRVQLLMTRDPLSRVSLLLLHADKRLGAALELAENGQFDLAEETAMKAEGYLDRGVKEVVDLFQETDEGLLMGRKLELAGRKHLEVLALLQEMLPDQNKSTIAHLITAGTTRVDGLSAWLTESGVGVEEVEMVPEEMEGIDTVQVVEEDPRL